MQKGSCGEKMGYLHSPDLSSIPGLTPCFQVVNWKSLFKSEERILYLPTHVNLPEIEHLFVCVFGYLYVFGEVSIEGLLPISIICGI